MGCKLQPVCPTTPPDLLHILPAQNSNVTLLGNNQYFHGCRTSLVIATRNQVILHLFLVEDCVFIPEFLPLAPHVLTICVLPSTQSGPQKLLLLVICCSLQTRHESRASEGRRDRRGGAGLCCLDKVMQLAR